MTYCTTTQTTSTSALQITESSESLTTEHTMKVSIQLNISEIVAIIIGGLLGTVCLWILLIHSLRILLIHTLLIRYGLREQLYFHHHSISSCQMEQLKGISTSTTQYKIKRKQRNDSVARETLINV